MEQRTGGSSTVGGNNNGNVSKVAKQIGEAANIDFDEIRDRIGDANERFVGFIKERPGTAILIALGAGFLIGRLLRS